MALYKKKYGSKSLKNYDKIILLPCTSLMRLIIYDRGNISSSQSGLQCFEVWISDCLSIMIFDC
jgi:hypothetical protein